MKSAIVTLSLLGLVGCGEQDQTNIQLQAQLDAHQAALDEATGQIASLQEELAAVTGAVDLTELAAQVERNGAGVAQAEVAIAANAQAASDNGQAIAANAQAIDDNLLSVADAAAAIAANAQAAADNGAAVSAAAGEVSALDGRLSSVEAGYLTASDISGLATQASVDAIEPGIPGLDSYLSVNTNNDRVIFTGANLHVRSGGGSTDATVNGLGNLVIGYNESNNDTRTGSHNLVVGPYHSFTSYGGIVGGYNNEVSGIHAGVLSGRENHAAGSHSALVSGLGGTVTGRQSAVLAGAYATVTGERAAVVAGFTNLSAAAYAVAVGGAYAEASSGSSVVVGGYGETTSTNYEILP